MSQSNLNLATKTAGPVECLGHKFPSEEARREHYRKLLAQKLKDPEFRKIEGFPIGKDEDILALSDPPYYTACPNPWLAEFIEAYSTPYDPKKPYHCEPFATDVSEGKNHPIYNAHSYHTKVPHRAIMRYILHYTQPGDVVFDGFCGTGMTGVAAQLCGDRAEVQELGYRVQNDGTILDEEGKAFSKLGARRAILNDLAPAASFIAYNYTTPIDASAFDVEAKRILNEVEDECGWMFETTHADGRTKGRINFTVWSEVFACGECGREIVYWDAALDRKAEGLREEFECPHCKALINKRQVERIVSTDFDQVTGETLRNIKHVPVVLNYSIDGNSKRFEKRPDAADFAVLKKVQATKLTYRIPAKKMMFKGEKWGDSWRAGMHTGFTHSHQFYTRRNLHVLSSFFEKAQSSPIRQLLFVFTSAHQYCLRLCRLHIGNYFSKKGGLVDKPLDGTLYMPSISVETDAIARLELRSRIGKSLFQTGTRSMIESRSLTAKSQLPAESLDYLFLDPPFGGNLMYSELNFFWECWLQVWTNNKHEAIENDSQGKSSDDYEKLMRSCFIEAYRLLKPGRWMTVEFSNTQARTWNAIQVALQEAGFVVANVSSIDKQKVSFKAVTNPTSVKQDLIISAYKPNGGLEDRFAKRGETEEGAWDFIRTHMKNLPVVKAKGGQMELIVERDPRILYDRMVAFYVGHSTPVPLSSAEFQAGLAEKFPERDGMFFLPEQVNEYDKKRAQIENIGQLAIFVEDERSAINWLRSFLTGRPSVSQDIQPEFMQQLGASWKKWEARPEMSALLDQNFLCYDGTGDVPSQIHSYLSTQFKELRNLGKDSAPLKTKARNRWYVPDPKRNVDVETLRNKRLLDEFWSYLPEGYSPPGLTTNKGQTLPGLTVPRPKIPKGKKLKELRTEAVRVGFKHCYQQKDYTTILVVAEMIPDSVLNEDEQLQMIYDTAVTRTGGGD